jgi:hypothetical protein
VNNLKALFCCHFFVQREKQNKKMCSSENIYVADTVFTIVECLRLVHKKEMRNFCKMNDNANMNHIIVVAASVELKLIMISIAHTKNKS